MIAIWDNPEWVRHRRAILRPATTIAVVAVSWLLCALIAYVADTKTMIGAVILAHMIGLPLWVGSTCGNSIMQERAFQTFDFWRTTRLTPGELVAGQLCGVPLMGILAVGSTIPVALLSIGIEVNPVNLALIYIMLTLFCVTVGTGSLVFSMGATPFRGSRVLTWIIGLYLVSSIMAFANGTGMGLGLSVMTPYPFLGDMLGAEAGAINFSASNFSVSQSTVLFGVMPVPSFLLGITLNLSFSGWFMLMLSRNIKKERHELRLLSRWQAVGFAVFITLLFHALGISSRPEHNSAASIIQQSLFFLNVLLLYLIGIITLTPPERLRIWWQRWSTGRSTYLHEDGFPWPWVVLTTICLAGVAYLSASISGRSSPTLLWNLGLVAVFAMRDITFLQWCQCQNFKRPLFTGALYLGLYYFVVQLLAITVPDLRSLLAPPMVGHLEPTQPIVTVMIQGLIAGGLLHLLSTQLKKPARSVSPSSGGNPQPPMPTESSFPLQ
ncbi:MAG: hypothetical protein OEY28_02280 [Nitrospira sp.]|nr:hypothetical protein [Nitrospira sp.]